MIYLIDKQDVDNIAEAIRLNLKESNSTNDLVTLIFNYTPDEEFSSKMNDFDMYSLGVLELNCDNIKNWENYSIPINIITGQIDEPGISIYYAGPLVLGTRI